MELKNIQQIDFEKLNEIRFDILIMVSGYEDRCSFLATHLSSVAIHKIVFGFREKKNEGFRHENDQVFSSLNYDFHETSGESGNDIQLLLDELLQDEEKDKLSILVDYSCMTKEWYSAIVNHCVNWDFKMSKLDLYFSYTPSMFEKPKKKNLLSKLKRNPISGNPGTAGKPVALILGLGYDQHQALELVNRIRPAVTYAFYSDPSHDKRFVEEVKKINQDVLQNLPDSHIFKFPMNDFRQINLLLKELVIDLRLQSQVILAPIGPKPFALSCMLLSAQYPDVWVWKVHTGNKKLNYVWKPLGIPLVCKAEFILDEDVKWGND